MNLATWPERRLFRHRRAANTAPFPGQPWVRSVALLIIIGMLSWLGLAQLRTPPVIPAAAPATSFSAERAMSHLDVIAAESRAIGLPGLAVRPRTGAQMMAPGLPPDATIIRRTLTRRRPS